jgi:CheY-like chemotaxis protein
MSKRILVVEDQEDDRQIIRDMLAGTDYEITEAEDGEQALTAVAKERPDLILMEIQLPSKARRIRLLVLLAVLARVRGAGFDLAVHAGEW